MMPLIVRIAAAVAILAAGYLASASEECTSEKAGKKCTSEEWSCDNTCHPMKDVRCNGWPQCSDRSDEKGCTEEECNTNKGLFKCDDGECLAKKYKRDRRHHCLDGSDEKNCEKTDLISYCKRRYKWLQCGSSWQCVMPEWRCKGEARCRNGFDQMECGGNCNFNCSNGQCGKDRCNGYIDCLDGSDESDCEGDCNHIDTRLCEDEKQCIQKDDWCNGLVNCKDGSDEKNCNCSGLFKCHDNSSCINKRNLCDGYLDCRDRSDETNCTGKDQCVDSYHYARCSDNECIDKRGLCDGVAQCKDHSDEIGCGMKCSKKGLFFCKNGECTRRRCDGKKDCLDGTDEENCLLT